MPERHADKASIGTPCFDLGATPGGLWTGDQGHKLCGWTRVDNMSLMPLMDYPTGARWLALGPGCSAGGQLCGLDETVRVMGRQKWMDRKSQIGRQDKSTHIDLINTFYNKLLSLLFNPKRLT